MARITLRQQAALYNELRDFWNENGRPPRWSPAERSLARRGLAFRRWLEDEGISPATYGARDVSVTGTTEWGTDFTLRVYPMRDGGIGWTWRESYDGGLWTGPREFWTDSDGDGAFTYGDGGAFRQTRGTCDFSLSSHVYTAALEILADRNATEWTITETGEDA